jgi:hypothetical protein
VDLTDYDDTPYRERPTVAPVYTISVDLEPVDNQVYVYVDGPDERLARQRFNAETFTVGDRNGTFKALRWVNLVLSALVNDPDGRNACGDCGNYVLGGGNEHAPDCRWSRWKQRNAD